MLTNHFPANHWVLFRPEAVPVLFSYSPLESLGLLFRGGVELFILALKLALPSPVFAFNCPNVIFCNAERFTRIVQLFPIATLF